MSASKKASPLSWAHPVVRDWFLSRFGSATEPQEQGWPHILAGKTTLISAPTGSGKTLSAFLACIDQLTRKAIDGTLEERTYVLYVSPLKALSNDIQINLKEPLAAIKQLASCRGIEMKEIRTAVRTGDTLPAERRAMLKRPPHILVTTPESLFILLTADKSREFLKGVETVIIDEIHAVADDKRGSHLALTVERLERLTEKPPTRIGLSATQKPIEEVAAFLASCGRPEPVIVNIESKRQLDLKVEVPSLPLGPVATNEMWEEIYDKIADLSRFNRSILVFVNTRKLSERMALNLGQRLGEGLVAAHHGSLSRKIRLAAEKKLKSGQIKILVATASLELGIDIGAIDLVCLISSPRSIAAALQRIGRSGHWRGAVPKGRLFATTRDDMLECAALVRAIHEKELDRLHIPEAPLDVLAQQIVAMCAVEEWNEDNLFRTVTKAYPYRALQRRDFDDILHMLSDGIAARRGRYGAYLFRDKVNGIVKGRRGAKLAAVTNGGAIVDRAMYSVLAEPDQVNVGTLDEDFAVESNRGDIFLLGNTSWRIKRVESVGRVLVEDAHGAAPTVPFWMGEAPGRTMELSQYLCCIRRAISTGTKDVRAGGVYQKDPQVKATADWLKEHCGLDDTGAEQAIEYVVETRSILGAVPDDETVVAERFFDEGGGMQLIIHSPFGARVNKAWGLALRKRFCTTFDFELQAAATDNGISIALSDQHSFPLADVFDFLHEENLQSVLEQATLPSPIFATRFRWDATRALALLRFSGGKRVPPVLLRLRSEDLLAAVFPQAVACQDNVAGDLEIPDHPLVREVMRDVLTEALDMEGLERILRGIKKGTIRCIAVDTPVPSQFSHEILNSNPYSYLDDAPLEERRARAVQMRRVLPQSVIDQVGLLDPSAIERVIEESWPDVRDENELHDVLQSLIAFSEETDGSTGLTQGDTAHWNEYFARLEHTGRASRAQAKGVVYWVAAERARSFKLLFPQAEFSRELKDVETPPSSPEQALQAMLRGWLSIVGPVTSLQLAQRLTIPVEDVYASMLLLESEGFVLRGRFRSNEEGSTHEQIEWCHRRLLARIHNLTVGTLRKQIEPVSAAIYMRWLTHWQHVAPGTQLAGQRGTLTILKQLQGFELAANAWEIAVLSNRITHYDGDNLDKLCLTGQIGWGRLSPHPATLMENRDDLGSKTHRITPTSVAPITFFAREEADWMMPIQPLSSEEETRLLSHAARSVRQYLQTRGASFFADIARGTALLKSEVETALWELVAAGLVTADGFDNLRALIDPKRRSGQGTRRFARPRHSTGRWSLLYSEPVDQDRAVEAACRMLLNRYGVIFRDMLARETSLPRWRDLLDKFRRMEERGEVRGGRLVSGFLGEQFALPEAFESLRAMKKREPAGELVTISAYDPLNLIGIILPGEKVPANSGRKIRLKDGLPIQDQNYQ
ncbi:MAG TPA: DEAD/DEAH box helicase [Planktothrix sp.]